MQSIVFWSVILPAIMVVVRSIHTEPDSPTYMTSGCINKDSLFTINQCDQSSVIQIVYAFQGFAATCVNSTSSNNNNFVNSTNLSNASSCGTTIDLDGKDIVETTTYLPTTASMTTYLPSTSSNISGSTGTVSASTQSPTSGTGTTATMTNTKSVGPNITSSVSKCNNQTACYLMNLPAVTSSCGSNYSVTNLLVVYYLCIPTNDYGMTTESPTTTTTQAPPSQCIHLTVGLVVGLCGALLIVVIVLAVILCLRRKADKRNCETSHKSKTGIRTYDEIEDSDSTKTNGRLKPTPTHSEVKKEKPAQTIAADPYNAVVCTTPSSINSRKQFNKTQPKFCIVQASKRGTINGKAMKSEEDIPEFYDEVPNPPSSRTNQGGTIERQNGFVKKDLQDVESNGRSCYNVDPLPVAMPSNEEGESDGRSYYNVDPRPVAMPSNEEGESDGRSYYNVDPRPVATPSNGEFYEEAETVKIGKRIAIQTGRAGEQIGRAGKQTGRTGEQTGKAGEQTGQAGEEYDVAENVVSGRMNV